MLDKVNVTKIIRDHFGTFKDYSSGKRRRRDFFLFIFVPLVVACLFVKLHGVIPKSLIEIIVTSLSIFTALLLNLLLLAYDVARNSDSRTDEHSSHLRERLFKEIFSNIAFAVLVALMTVVSVLYFGVITDSASFPTKRIFSLGIYGLGILFLLTILMLLKRVYVLLSNEKVGEMGPNRQDH